MFWRDAVPAFGCEGFDLRSPHQANLGPAVKEDHQRPVTGPASL
jgi:hypothetical protein